MSSGTMQEITTLPFPSFLSGATANFDIRASKFEPGPSDESPVPRIFAPFRRHAGRYQIDQSWIQEPSSGVSAEDVTSKDYVITLSRIEDLRQEEEEDRPSDYAYDRAVALLRGAAQELRLNFLRASASVGPGLGLRITWSSGAQEVRLICGGSPERKTYIYKESSTGGHRVDFDVSGVLLADHLRRILQEG